MDIFQTIGGITRVRTCGLLMEGDGLLMVNHRGLYGHDFWAPPGGGLEFGNSVPANLKREFLEECGLEIEPADFRFACNVVRPKLHAVELFYRVTRTGGRLTKGTDPEYGNHQIITDVRFISIEEILAMPREWVHPLFTKLNNQTEIMEFRGFMEFT